MPATVLDKSFPALNYEEQGGARTVIGGTLEIAQTAGGKLTVDGVDVTGAVNGGAVAGIAAGYKIARGVAAVTGTLGIVTGLTTIIAASVTLAEDAAITGDAVSYTFSGGTLTAKVWKRTATGDCTPIAATAAKNIGWLAVGV
jgi:hypothetical protein